MIDETTRQPRPARVALSLKPVYGTGRWDWSLAGEGFSTTGTVTAHNREDAVVCAIADTYHDLTAHGPVHLVVSLPRQARLWSLAEDLAACFTGVTVTGYTDADAALRDAAMHALEPAPVVVDEPALPALTVATDGSAAHGRIGWGWLASDGQHAYGSTTPSRRCSSTRTLPVLAELRAISAAVRALPRRHLEIRTDSQAAITLIRDWVHGGDRVPTGYVTAHPSASAKGGLVWMQHQVRREAHRIDIGWVRGHTGDPLNEGADCLAKLARRHAERRWGLTDEDIAGRAASIAAAFATQPAQDATAA